jgi:hypothetical protein
MVKRYVGMTIKEHIENGKTVTAIKDAVLDLLSECSSKFGTSKKPTKYVRNVYNSLISLQSALDDEYHKIATDEDFSKHGHVYYKRERKEKEDA